ncbi:ABC transporter substrate binding protein [Aliikangiella sp. G2MR2-5]|uniref:ABC transporter substrate binding protein n=1 Tax=Aliikangiella sp. G2MR2-5 TaxID=2788943 RepID=UPI0018ABC4A1|nr:ABC transporter substrate binding protein [Aliikangiella sp. G2MR2-5]
MRKTGRFLSYLCLLLPLFMSAFSAEESHAADQQPATNRLLLVLHQELSDEQIRFLENFKQQSSDRLSELKIETVDIRRFSPYLLESLLDTDISCVMTIGTNTLSRTMKARAEVPVFATYAPAHLLEKYHRVYANLSLYISGIYEEQTFQRQLTLAQVTKPGLKKVLRLFNKSDMYYLPEFRKQAKSMGLSLDFKLLSAHDPTEQFITNLQDPDEHQVLLLSNNNALFGEKHIAGVVLKAHKQNMIMIGNQLKSVEQGAFAAIYTPTVTLAIEAASELKSICLEEKRPEPHFATGFDVKVNKHIANMLGLTNIDANTLKNRLDRAESARTHDSKTKLKGRE